MGSYLTEKCWPIKSEPLDFWKNNGTKYPYLSKLAKRFLGAPPSSAPSERLFSVAGRIYTERRNRLDGKRAEGLMFLKCNLKKIEYSYDL